MDKKSIKVAFGYIVRIISIAASIVLALFLKMFDGFVDDEGIIVMVNVLNKSVVIKDIAFNGEYIDLFNKDEKYKFIGDTNIISISKRDFKILRKM